MSAGSPRVVWSEEQQRFVPAGAKGSGEPGPRARVIPDGGDRTVLRPAPAPSRAPTQAPPPPPPTAQPRRRRRWRRALLLLLALVVALVALGGVFAWVQFQRIDRVEVSPVLSAGGGGGTNYLIVGSDSREGIDPGDPNAGAFIGQEVSGARTDTIMVLRVTSDGSQLLSIPRDLWVTNAVTGEPGRINSTYQTSPAALIQTVQQSLGIPVHHYLEIDFTSFGDLVDAVGGITVNFEHPARDDNSGLLVEETGPVTLDGTQALAYVRSRNYTELVDGQWQTDPTADIGRTERQRAFLTTLLGEVGSARNPLALRSIVDSLGGGMRIDDSLTFWDALRLGWELKGLAPESVELPVVGRMTSGGASVLDLGPGSSEVLERFS